MLVRIAAAPHAYIGAIAGDLCGQLRKPDVDHTLGSREREVAEDRHQDGYGDGDPSRLACIGVGFDGSRDAVGALGAAAALAEASGARVRVITTSDIR